LQVNLNSSLFLQNAQCLKTEAIFVRMVILVQAEDLPSILTLEDANPSFTLAVAGILTDMRIKMNASDPVHALQIPTTDSTLVPNHTLIVGTLVNTLAPAINSRLADAMKATTIISVAT
jgi:hypothetical protein